MVATAVSLLKSLVWLNRCEPVSPAMQADPLQLGHWGQRDGGEGAGKGKGEEGGEPLVPRSAGGPLTAGPVGRWGGGFEPCVSCFKRTPYPWATGDTWKVGRVSGVRTPCSPLCRWIPYRWATGDWRKVGRGSGGSNSVSPAPSGPLTAGLLGTDGRWGGEGGSNPVSPALQVDTLPVGHRGQPEDGEGKGKGRGFEPCAPISRRTPCLWATQPAMSSRIQFTIEFQSCILYCA